MENHVIPTKAFKTEVKCVLIQFYGNTVQLERLERFERKLKFRTENLYENWSDY